MQFTSKPGQLVMIMQQLLYNKSGYAEIIAHMGQHNIAFNDIWSTVPTMIQSLQTIPIQRATAYEEWLNGTIIHFVEKFQSFRSVESQGFNKMSKFSISATSLKDQILLMGAQIEASQFDVYNRNLNYFQNAFLQICWLT
ncbi:Hypothetical_protein [Hexamita inflata]|uniref:Hypothetical_protein n=1 Tax=Hexamita inflata TaxID=28002 RepID=A0AA86QKN8_9EUKA|nr:Hypothetical protein HINF_LOCUS48080 [Hexamita inflata]